MGMFIDQTWDCRGCCNLHGLGCQQVALEKIRVLCFTPGCHQLQGSCPFDLPQSESAFVRIRRSARWLVQSASAVCPML